MSSKKCKNGQNPEHWQHRSAGEDVEQEERSFIAGGNAEGFTLEVKTGTLEDSWEVSYKTKHTLTIQSSNHAPWHLPKWDENLCPLKNLHMNAYSSCLHFCQNLEAIMMSFSRWTDKLWSIQTMEHDSTLKGNDLLSHKKIRRKLKCIL